MIPFDSCILAVDAGGTSLKAALLPSGPDGRLFGMPSYAMPEHTFFSIDVPSEGTKEEILASYREVGRKGALLASRQRLAICHIAVCIPGPFDYQKGCSLMSHKYRSVFQVPLGPELKKGGSLSCPVTFLHDSTAFLLGAAASLLAERPTVCGVIIGTGLGFACMTDGVVQESSTGGPAVSIYRRPYLDGIAEDYVSKPGILRRYREKTGMSEKQNLPTVAEIAGMARMGDRDARDVFADTGVHLGHILLPVLDRHPFSTVLLGGAISKSADLFLTQLNHVLREAGAAAQKADDIDFAPLAGAARYVCEGADVAARMTRHSRVP